MAKICSKEKTKTKPDRDSVQKHFSESSVSDKGTDTALLVTLSPTSEEGKQHIKALEAFQSPAEDYWAARNCCFLVHLGTRLGSRGEQEEQEMLLSWGPTFSSQHSQGECRKHREQIYTTAIWIPSATSLPQKAISSFHTSASQRGDYRGYTVIRCSLSLQVRVFSLLWGSRMGEERARKKRRRGENYRRVREPIQAA